MRFYAQSPLRRTWQVLGDAMLLVWLAVWLLVADVVHEAVSALATPGEQLQESAASLGERLRGAGETVSGLPLVGDDVATPFRGAGSAADRIAAAGAQQAEAADALAFWLTLTVALVPTLLALALYLPRRVRFVREATAGARLVDSSADLELFALRALTRQPLHRLATVSDDPVAAWRSREPDVVSALAALELADAGLAPPRSLAGRA